jgi:hypothetical protein
MSRPTDVPGNRARSTSFLTRRKLESRPSSIVSEAPSMTRHPSDITDRAEVSLLTTSTGGRTVGPTSTGLMSTSVPSTSQFVPPHHHNNHNLPPTPLLIPNQNLGLSPLLPSSSSMDFLTQSPSLGNDGNPLEWTDQPALYQCACVADFKLGVRKGRVWYAGLPFLDMDEGDVIE